jgi:hypothetical protein
MKDYKKILEGIVNIINTTEKNDIGFANICTYISENCPELKENEDERIRKELISYFQYMADNYPNDIKYAKVGNWIAWLKENEDERIRKELISYFQYMADNYPNDIKYAKVGNWIAWLEKQGEQNPYSGVSFKYNGHTWGMCARDNGVEILVDGEIKERVFLGSKPQGKSALEAINEEKVDNDNKVETKFHEGDWVILTAGELSTTLQIVKVDTNKRLYWFNDSSYLPIVDEECLHLWTIQDAKDGDVIYSRHYTESFEWIGIFKSLDKENKRVFFYGFWHNISKSFSVCRKEAYVLYNDFSPATKEQREQLEKAMAVAGFTFDFEKKELKKIENKSNL